MRTTKITIAEDGDDDDANEDDLVRVQHVGHCPCWSAPTCQQYTCDTTAVMMVSWLLVFNARPVQSQADRLVGLVVNASRAEDPGFESRLRRDFFGVESYQ